MIYRSRGFIAGLLFSIFACIWSAALRIRDYAVLPIIALIRDSPVGPFLSVLPSFKVVAFRVIGILKPDYRESYDTHGLSLTSNRT